VQYQYGSALPGTGGPIEMSGLMGLVAAAFLLVGGVVSFGILRRRT